MLLKKLGALSVRPMLNTDHLVTFALGLHWFTGRCHCVCIALRVLMFNRLLEIYIALGLALLRTMTSLALCLVSLVCICFHA